MDCKVRGPARIDACPISPHLRRVPRPLRRGAGSWTPGHRYASTTASGIDYYPPQPPGASGQLGAQNSVLGGGRYDGLVKELGGPDLTGIGFALGMERLVMLLPAAVDERRCDVFLAPLVPDALDPALLLQRDLRRAGLRVLLDHEGRGLKSQMKKADKLGARLVAIRGEDERAKDVWVVRDMAGSSQEEVKAADVAPLQEKLRGEPLGDLTRTHCADRSARRTWAGRSHHGWGHPQHGRRDINRPARREGQASGGPPGRSRRTKPRGRRARRVVLAVMARAPSGPRDREPKLPTARRVWKGDRVLSEAKITPLRPEDTPLRRRDPPQVRTAAPPRLQRTSSSPQQTRIPATREQASTRSRHVLTNPSGCARLGCRRAPPRSSTR